MHSIVKTLLLACRHVVSFFHKRLSVVTLAVTLLAGCVLAVPVAAEEQPAPTPVVEAEVRFCTFKLLESNMEAMSAATLTVPASYSGELVPLHRVTVTADGESKVLCLEAGHAALNVLNAAGIEMSSADYLNVESSRFVEDGMSLEVTRVLHKQYTKTYSISYTTETRYTPDLRQGATKVLQAGKKGVKTVTYENRVENGKVISTKTVKTEITTQPQKRIILKGTKVGKVVSEAPFDIAFDSLYQPLKYKKKLTGKATAYTTDRGDSGAWTSTGKRAQVGIVAVDPRKIPYGTKLWIVSADGKYVYGYAIAGDTGGALRSGKVLVDLFYDTYAECYTFGRRTMNVYILE